MTESLPIGFPIPGESAIISYNFTDVLGGYGLIDHYGIIGPATSTFNIINFLDDGSLEYFNSYYENGTTTMADFPVFNQPMTVRGKAFCVCYSKWVQASGGSTILKLYHVRGAVETLIGTFGTISHNNSDEVQRFTSATLTETNFAIGDTLRLKATVSITANGWQPYASTTNPFKISIPFRIEL